MSHFTHYRDHVGSSAGKPFKSTLWRTDRLMLGLNCLAPGQEQMLHDHADQDKFYFVVEGTGKPTEVMPGVAIVAKSTYAAFAARRKLKVTWDESSASKDSWTKAVADAQAAAKAGPGPEELKSIGDFDKAIRNLRAAVDEKILPLARKHRWSHRDEKSVELTALIAREQLDDVKRAGEELRAAAPHVPFLLSGPWPLEVFADDDHQ